MREELKPVVRLQLDTTEWLAELDELQALLNRWKEEPSNGIIREKIDHSLARLGIIAADK